MRNRGVEGCEDMEDDVNIVAVLVWQTPEPADGE